MVDFAHPSSRRAIDALRSGTTHATLFGFARCLSASDAAAQDLLQNAILRVCDPERGRPWDPSRATFVTHMRMLLRDLWVDGRKQAVIRREKLDEAAMEEAPSSRPDAERLLIEAQERAHLRRQGKLLRARLADDAVAARVFDLACEDVDRPADAAAAIGCRVEEVYAANRRIAYQAARVAAEEGDPPSAPAVTAGPSSATTPEESRP